MTCPGRKKTGTTLSIKGKKMGVTAVRDSLADKKVQSPGLLGCTQEQGY
jgi:hypothetical protein